jgi:hypothetical protein
MISYPGAPPSSVPTPAFYTVIAGASGANTIVGAITGKKISVQSGHLFGAGAVWVNWLSGSTAITGPVSLNGPDGYIIPFSPVGNFETAAGEPLVLNLSAGVSFGGVVQITTR